MRGLNNRQAASSGEETREVDGYYAELERGVNFITVESTVEIRDDKHLGIEQVRQYLKF